MQARIPPCRPHLKRPSLHETFSFRIQHRSRLFRPARRRNAGAQLPADGAQGGGAIRRQREIAQARAKFSGPHGRDPSIAELAEAMHTDVASVAAMDSDPLRIVSIDADYDESSAAFVDAEPDAFTRLVEAQDSARLASAVAKLPERLQLVLQLYFVDELNLSEIAETLEVSVPRVHQLKAGGLAKLREALGNQQP